MTEAIPSVDLASSYDRDEHPAMFSDVESLSEDPLREADLVGYYRIEDIVGSDDLAAGEHLDSGSQAWGNETPPAVPAGKSDFPDHHHKPGVSTLADALRETDLTNFFRPSARHDTGALHPEFGQEVATLEASESIPEPIYSSSDDLSGFGEEPSFQSHAAGAPPSSGHDVPHMSEAPLIASETLNDWIERVRLVGPTGLWLAFALRKARHDPNPSHLQFCHKAAKYVALSATGDRAQVAQALLAEIAAVIAPRA